MVNEAQLLDGVELHYWSWEYGSARKWEDASPLPAFNFLLDLPCPEEIRFFRCNSPLLLSWHVHIGTATVVLGAISALRKVFVTANVPPFARIATFTGLGMAPSRRSTAGSSHYKIRIKVRKTGTTKLTSVRSTMYVYERYNGVRLKGVRMKLKVSKRKQIPDQERKQV